MRCSLELVARVKELARIESVVSQDVSLERYGSFLRGASPFADEDSGSLYVMPESGTFRCVATGACGDVFVYVQKRRSCSFQSALGYLARSFGVES